MTLAGDGFYSGTKCFARLLFVILAVFVALTAAGTVRTTGHTVWKIKNRCSEGYLQMILRTILTNGDDNDSDCLTDFIVRTVGMGELKIQHRNSKRYLCFDKRKRLAARDDGEHDRCTFIEHMDEDGYMMLESLHYRRHYLGFNDDGKFLRPSMIRDQPMCFTFIKEQRYIAASERDDCGRKHRQPQPEPQPQPQPTQPPAAETITPSPREAAILQKLMLNKLKFAVRPLDNTLLEGLDLPSVEEPEEEETHSVNSSKLLFGIDC